MHCTQDDRARPCSLRRPQTDTKAWGHTQSPGFREDERAVGYREPSISMLLEIEVEGLAKSKNKTPNTSVAPPLKQEQLLLHMEASFILQNIKPFVQIFRSHDLSRHFLFWQNNIFNHLFLSRQKEKRNQGGEEK